MPQDANNLLFHYGHVDVARLMHGVKLDLLSAAAKLFSQSKFAESRSVVHMRKRCLNNVHKGVTDDKAF